MSTKNVRFEEFSEELEQRVRAFKNQWLDNDIKDPNNFPIEYPNTADWWEQFEMLTEE